MAFTGIQATVDFYTVRESDLTNQLTDIMTEITRKSKDTSSLTQEECKNKDAVRGEYTAGTDEYHDAMQEVTDDYDMKLAEITTWENELEVQKGQIETELKATTAYKESFQSALKQNVQSDMKYGGGGSQ